MSEQNSKKLWQSKTAWFGFLTAVAPMIGSIFGFDLLDIIQGKEELFGVIWGGIAIGLRFLTKDKIKLVD